MLKKGTLIGTTTRTRIYLSETSYQRQLAETMQIGTYCLSPLCMLTLVILHISTYERWRLAVQQKVFQKKKNKRHKNIKTIIKMIHTAFRCRQEQVIIIRLRTNQHQRRSYLLNKFILVNLSCFPVVGQNTRNSIWPVPRKINNTLYGNLNDLQRTDSFIVKSGVTVR